jgi:hypothetical protein
MSKENYAHIVHKRSTMEQAMLPLLLVSKLFATACQSQENSVLRALHKIYCVVAWCFLNYVNVQVLQEEQEKIKTEAQQGTKSENIIISYGALIFAYFSFLFNSIALYLAIFGSSKIDGLLHELKFIAVNLKCEVRVAKKVNGFLIRYIVVFITGTLLCLYQELSTWKEELQYNNRLILAFASTARMVWQEIQLTTFAYTTCLLLREINSNIAVRL